MLNAAVFPLCSLQRASVNQTKRHIPSAAYANCSLITWSPEDGSGGVLKLIRTSFDLQNDLQQI